MDACSAVPTPLDAEEARQLTGFGGRHAVAWASLLRRAFLQEPALHWLFPDACLRGLATQLWFTAMLHAARDAGRVWCLADKSAVAVWFAPGCRAETSGGADSLLRLLVSAHPLSRQRREALDAALRGYRPTDAHWHLSAVGTDPRFRGQGRGALVLRAGLELCDAEQALAYLETSEPRSVTFYERLGFAVRGEFETENGPRVWCMERRPRTIANDSVSPQRFSST